MGLTLGPSDWSSVVISRRALKLFPFLLLAIQDARNAWLLERTEHIADLISQASKQVHSQMGLLEGRLNRLEVRLKRGRLKGLQQLALQVENMGQLDSQSVGRLALIHADYLIQQKKNGLKQTSISSRH